MAIPGGVIGLIGTIGSGKSTLARFLKSEKGIQILRKYIPPNIPIEVIDEPTDPYARKAFYQDIIKNTDRFELSQAMNRMLRHSWTSNFPGVVILDTTLIGGFGTYGVNSYKNEGKFTHRGWRGYIRMIQDACDDFGRDETRLSKWLESLLFYLEVKDGKLLQKRQAERGDPNDAGIIPLEYIEGLNRRFENFLKNPERIYSDKFQLKAPRVVTLHGSINVKKYPEHLELCAHTIGREIRDSIQKNNETLNLYS